MGIWSRFDQFTSSPNMGINKTIILPTLQQSKLIIWYYHLKLQRHLQRIFHRDVGLAECVIFHPSGEHEYHGLEPAWDSFSNVGSDMPRLVSAQFHTCQVRWVLSHRPLDVVYRSIPIHQNHKYLGIFIAISMDPLSEKLLHPLNHSPAVLLKKGWTHRPRVNEDPYHSITIPLKP